jgi:hypothetical protein
VQFTHVESLSVFSGEFTDNLQINILDIGSAPDVQPPYQSLVDAGRARIKVALDQKTGSSFAASYLEQLINKSNNS